MEPGDIYLRWYFETNVWKQLHYRGIRTLKNVADMWNYQEIICERGVGWVIETGTRHGGSALFFADLLTSLGAEGHVFTIDIDHSDYSAPPHSRLNILSGDSADPVLAEKILAQLPKQRAPLFLILDSDHRADHVLRELETWVPRLKTGDYLVVEDGIVNGHPVRPEHGPGPWEAIEAYLQRHPGSLIHDRHREEKFGHTFAVKGYFIIP